MKRQIKKKAKKLTKQDQEELNNKNQIIPTSTEVDINLKEQLRIPEEQHNESTNDKDTININEKTEKTDHEINGEEVDKKLEEMCGLTPTKATYLNTKIEEITENYKNQNLVFISVSKENEISFKYFSLLDKTNVIYKTFDIDDSKYTLACKSNTEIRLLSDHPISDFIKSPRISLIVLQKS